MEERLEYWCKKYNLKNLKVVGYQGGYPMIQFDREEDMALLNMSKKEINKILRNSESYGGMELGVGWNFRKTSFLLINNETIVICGHEIVIDKILEKLFWSKNVI